LTESLLLATTNSGKISEMRFFLKELPLRIVNLSDFKPDVSFRENGRTFRENAEGKCFFYSGIRKGLTLSEDSGLVVDALNGEPGVHSARYAGPGASDEENIDKLLHSLSGLPPEKRTARFVSVMVLATDGRLLTRIEESVEGRISSGKKGKNGFGYDPVFFYPPLKKTFAELATAQKNSISHRGKALEKLKKFLGEYLSRPQEQKI
jgi:XTP/dITP diphosphohydrolase